LSIRRKHRNSPIILVWKTYIANRRYIELISGFDNKQTGRKKLEKISESKVENNRKYK
jgi:hypothetical protein